MAETIWLPVILKAVIEPNPVEAGKPAVIRVTVVDVFGGEQTETRYSGEFSAGEV